MATILDMNVHRVTESVKWLVLALQCRAEVKFAGQSRGRIVEVWLNEDEPAIVSSATKTKGINTLDSCTSDEIVHQWISSVGVTAVSRARVRIKQVDGSEVIEQPLDGMVFVVDGVDREMVF